MPCHVCGDVCRCVPAVRAASKTKFEIEPEDDSPILIDPEAFDASEQEFAASLDRVVTKTPVCRGARRLDRHGGESGSIPHAGAGRPALPASPVPVASESLWKEELAAKLNHYRARRSPKQPRFPSLQLKFEAEPTRQAPIESPVRQCLPSRLFRWRARNDPPSLKPPLPGRAGPIPEIPLPASWSFPALPSLPHGGWTNWRTRCLIVHVFLRFLTLPPSEPALGGITIGPVEKIERQAQRV